jgi:hypothetical protein
MGKTISIKFDQSKEGQKDALKIMSVLRKNIPKKKKREKMKKFDNDIH